MARVCKEGWLETYLQYVKTQESPQEYHTWVALSIISSALTRYTYMEHGRLDLYPNIYVILLGESATYRKSTAIKLGRDILKIALPNINYAAQKLTPEAAIGSMQTEFKKTKMSSLAFIAGELSVLLGSGSDNIRMIQFLTLIFDSEDHFAYETKGRGREQCDNLYVSLLGGSTLDWFRSSLPAEAGIGGFTGRFFFVFPSDSFIWKPEPWPLLTEREEDLKAKLVYDLKEIHRLRGKFHVPDDVIKVFSDWYRSKAYLRSMNVSRPLMRQYYARKPDGILKVAMLFSASRGEDLVVTEEDYVRAKCTVEFLEPKLPHVIDQLEVTLVGQDNMRILGCIKRERKIKHSDLLRRFSSRYSSSQLKDVIATLEEQGQIKVAVIVHGRGKPSTIYEFTKKVRKDDVQCFPPA